MSLLMTALEAFMAGVVVFVVAPLATAGLPRRVRQSVSDTYLGLAMTLLGRGVLMRRSHGGQLLKRTSYDASAGGEKAVIGGETKHWKDPHNFMSTFQGKPFGIVHEDRNVVLNPRIVHLARLFADLKQKGDWIMKGHRKQYFTLDEGAVQLVDVADVMPAIQTKESPGLIDRLDTYIEKAHSQYDSSQAMEYLPWLLGLAAGCGLIWIASKVADTAGQSSGVVPI